MRRRHIVGRTYARGRRRFLLNFFMDTFIHIWNLLTPAYEFTTPGRHRACRRLWESFDLQRQRYTFRTIRDKLRKGEPVNPNPYFAIEDNSHQPAIRLPTAHPTNYNGARSLPAEPLVRAVYNGTGGIYTRREALLFRMDIKGDFVL